MNDTTLIIKSCLLVLLRSRLFLQFKLINKSVIILLKVFITCIDSTVFNLNLSFRVFIWYFFIILILNRSSL